MIIPKAIRLFIVLFSILGVAVGQEGGRMNSNDQVTTKEEKQQQLEDFILFVGQGCPYCDRVLTFLKENNLSITIKDVRLDAKAREELLTLTNGKKQIPCLRMGDKEYMHESLDIITKIRSLLSHQAIKVAGPEVAQKTNKAVDCGKGFCTFK